MSILSFFIFVSVFIVETFGLKQSPALKSIRKITVMASQVHPYVFHDKQQSVRGLDVDIIENFAKRFNFDIEYVIRNKSLKEVFSSEELFDKFVQSIQDS